MKPTVLVTDADSGLTAVIRQFLTRHGYAVETASDGLECLEKLRRFAPNALVLHRELPWGGGDGVLEYLRDERLSLPPAVVLTDWDSLAPPMPDNGTGCVVHCLQKPFTLSTLLRSLSAAQPESACAN